MKMMNAFQTYHAFSLLPHHHKGIYLFLYQEVSSLVYGIFYNSLYNILGKLAEEGTFEKEDNLVVEQSLVEQLLVEDIRAGNRVDNQVGLVVDKQKGDILGEDNQAVEEDKLEEDNQAVEVEVDSLEVLHKD